MAGPSGEDPAAVGDAAPPPVEPDDTGPAEDWPPDWAPEPGEIVPPASRDVTPPGITAGPVVDGPLVRVEGVRPLPVPRARPRPRTERMFRVTVRDAGTLVSGDDTIRLAGINAPAVDETCGPAATPWPCGRMARAALARFIRGRAVECDVPFDAETVPETATCSVAGRDLSGWLVAQGWARTSGLLHRPAAEAAQAADRGIWSPERP